MRRLFSLLVILILTCGVQAAIVINEFYYDMAGGDTGEYIELYNEAASPQDISGWQVLLVNGATGTAYLTITIPSGTVLPGNDYYVIGNLATIDAVFGAGTVDQDVDLNNGLQNGGPPGNPDAIVLKDSGGTRMDSVNYEADAVFTVDGETGNAIAEGGTGRSLARSFAVGMVSFGRLPNGVDSNVNLKDFTSILASPGLPNTASVTLPFSDSFTTAQSPPWLPGGFTDLRVVDPTAAGKPGVASPDGGNCLEVFDPTGGGDVVNIAGSFDKINFQGFIWIPADAAPDMGWSTGVGIVTRADITWFSNFTFNAIEGGYYLEYQNGTLGDVLKGGAVPAHSGSAALLAVNGTPSINSGNVNTTVVTVLGSTTAVTKGAWNAFRLAYDKSDGRLFASIEGTVIYNGAPTGATHDSGGVVVGFREQHTGTPGAGEGTWIDGAVLNTDVPTSVNEWMLY